MRGTAETVQAGLVAAKPDVYIGVFYDPMAASPLGRVAGKQLSSEEWQAAWEKRKAAARQISEQQLREQVRDFIAWLKAQGVI